MDVKKIKHTCQELDVELVELETFRLKNTLNIDAIVWLEEEIAWRLT